MLTKQRLNELLDFDDVDRLFRWRISKGRQKKGSVAGKWIDDYRYIVIDKISHPENRLIMLHLTGSYPTTKTTGITVDRAVRYSNLPKSYPWRGTATLTLFDNVERIESAYQMLFESCATVYFLILNGEIVYVGSTKCLAKRLAEHAQGAGGSVTVGGRSRSGVTHRKLFDQVYYMRFSDILSAKRMEIALIRLIKPKLNTEWSDYVSTRKVGMLRDTDVAELICLL